MSLVATQEMNSVGNNLSFSLPLKKGIGATCSIKVINVNYVNLPCEDTPLSLEKDPLFN